MSNWVSDLLDQRADVKDELWKLEEDLKRKRERRARTAQVGSLWSK